MACVGGSRAHILALQVLLHRFTSSQNAETVSNPTFTPGGDMSGIRILHVGMYQ